MENKQIICRQCGSIIPPGQARCPYCGSSYEPEAEREYMRKLEQVRADLDQVGEAGAEASSREIKRVSSRVMRILGVILVFAVIVMGIVHWHQQRENVSQRPEAPFPVPLQRFHHRNRRFSDCKRNRRLLRLSDAGNLHLRYQRKFLGL